MAERHDVYKCMVCGNIVAVLTGGGGELVCCGSSLIKQVEKTGDAAREKHVPVIEKGDGVVTVKVGDVAHPMEDKHYIEWIELLADGKSYFQFFNPGDVAKASFSVSAAQVTARAYCNLHGLWKA